MTSFATRLINLPHWGKQIILMGVDGFICFVTVLFAFYLRLGEWVPMDSLAWRPSTAFLLSVLVAAPVFWFGGLYRNIVRFLGLPVVLLIARIFFIYAILFGSLTILLSFYGVPRTIGLIQPVLFFIGVVSSRVLASIWLSGAWDWQGKKPKTNRAIIYGANRLGQELLDALKHNHQIQVLAFVDDDAQFVHKLINGVKVYTAENLDELFTRWAVTDLILAMPQFSRQKKEEIIKRCTPYHVHIRTLPGTNDLLTGKVAISDLRELDIADLLGRPMAKPDENLLRHHLNDRVVLVTGAGGSIGSQLCEETLQQHPKQLILFEQSEFNLYHIHQILSQRVSNDALKTILTPILGSVTHQDQVDSIFTRYRPQTVFHAAAYKHVPLVEANPFAAIENNVFGTLTICEAAIRHEVGIVTLISTDKAVRPTNIMGATKRVAELILQAMATQSQTIFAMVRFGNVLNSSGSVVPLFKKQIQEGGPITLTHPDVTRYFMTIAEASQLVIQASAMAKGGEVFLLDMGEPVRIYDLACKMIELSGRTLLNEENPGGDIEIQITGLRPGEKLYEELLIGDQPEQTSHPLIFKARESALAWSELKPYLDELHRACQKEDLVKCKQIFSEIVADYPKISE